jgi:nicotinamide-nucleotide amidase
LTRAHFIPDALDEITRYLAQCKASIVVVSGGLGPTTDDLTRDAAALFMNVPLVEDALALEKLTSLFAARNVALTPNNFRQCLFPQGAEVLYSTVGTAAGFRLERGEQNFFFFPGVPREFEWFCQTYLNLEKTSHQSSTLLFFGRGESHLENDLAGIEELNVSVGYRAAYPVIELKLSGASQDVQHALSFAKTRTGQWLIAEDDESLSARIGRLLKQRAMTVATAESCTAGGIAAEITRISGSSEWFHEGFVTYANHAKVRALGVLTPTLEQFGAVSQEVACQMALGAQRVAESTYAIAVTGIAGPTGGTELKPVGTVHFALAAPDGVWHRHFVFRRQSREGVREATIVAALTFLLHHLEERLKDYPTLGPYAAEDVMTETGPHESPLSRS